MTKAKQAPSGIAASRIDGALAIEKKHRKRHIRPGAKALREIRKYQKSTGLLCANSSFAKLTKEIAQQVIAAGDHGNTVFSLGPDDIRFKKSAMECIQTAAEAFLTGLFSASIPCMIHAGRETMKPEDMRLATELSHKDVHYSMHNGIFKHEVAQRMNNGGAAVGRTVGGERVEKE